MALPESYTATEVTRLVLGWLRDQGVDLAPMAAAVGAEAEDLSAPEGRVPLATEHRLLEWAARTVDNPALGLTLGRQVTLERLGVVGYLTLQQPSLWAMLETYAHYHRLLHGLATWHLERTGRTDRVLHRLPLPPSLAVRVANDLSLAGAWRVLQLASGGGLTLRAVQLAHTAPPDLAPYRACFGPARLRFGAAENGLEFPHGQLDQPLGTTDSHLAQLLRGYAEQALAALPQQGSATQEVRRLVAELLPHRLPGIDEVARRLGHSRRTLQRRLGSEGTVYRELVDQVRRELALGYLANPTLTVTEVGWLCAFSEPAAFTHAFQRWTGRSPRAWRSGQGTGPG